MDFSQILSAFPQMMGAAQPQQQGGMPPMQPLGTDQFYDPTQQAQLAADQVKLQRNMQLANAFMQQGGQYTPNSGKAGIFAGLASLIRGKVMQGQNEDSLKDVLGRQFQQENAAAQAKRQQDMEDEQRKMYEKIFENTQSARGTAQANKEFAKSEFTGGGVFDPSSGGFTPSKEWMDQQLALKDAQEKIGAKYRQGPADPFASIKTAVAQGVITPDEAQKRMHDVALGMSEKGANAPAGYQWTPQNTLAAIPGGPADPNQPTKPRPLSEGAANALAKINNAIANAKEYQARTVGPNGQFKDVAANLNDTPQLMNSAVQDMLYAKSGANAPAAEVAKAQAMYSPGLFEKDTTASAKVSNFIRDMERMRDQYTQGTSAEGSPEPQAFGQPGGGAHKVGDVITVHGKQYKVVGGNPADPDLAPL